MASVFTKIIAGELPGRFIWKDDKCVALLSGTPLKPGHAMVVPREEIDHWIDLPADLANHLLQAAQKVGQGIQKAFRPTKVGLAVIGIETRHVHLHLVPIDAVAEMEFSRQDRNADPARLDAAAESLRAALRELGHSEVAD